MLEPSAEQVEAAEMYLQDGGTMRMPECADDVRDLAALLASRERAAYARGFAEAREAAADVVLHECVDCMDVLAPLIRALKPTEGASAPGDGGTG